MPEQTAIDAEETETRSDLRLDETPDEQTDEANDLEAEYAQTLLEDFASLLITNDLPPKYWDKWRRGLRMALVLINLDAKQAKHLLAPPENTDDHSEAKIEEIAALRNQIIKYFFDKLGFAQTTQILLDARAKQLELQIEKALGERSSEQGKDEAGELATDPEVEHPMFIVESTHDAIETLEIELGMLCQLYLQEEADEPDAPNLTEDVEDMTGLIHQLTSHITIVLQEPPLLVANHRASFLRALKALEMALDESRDPEDDDEDETEEDERETSRDLLKRALRQIMIEMRVKVTNWTSRLPQL
jgi:hypothetical protein